VSKTRSCNYSLEAPDDERYYKDVKQLRNNGIIICPTQFRLVGHSYEMYFRYDIRSVEERRVSRPRDVIKGSPNLKRTGFE
jgi:hypothetical protein